MNIDVGELGRAVARVEAKLDRHMADHERRIRANEKWRWGLVGATGTTVIGSTVTLVHQLGVGA